jgi:hypothetical protein
MAEAVQAGRAVLTMLAAAAAAVSGRLAPFIRWQAMPVETAQAAAMDLFL